MLAPELALDLQVPHFGQGLVPVLKSDEDAPAMHVISSPFISGDLGLGDVDVIDLSRGGYL
jgi:hypothetical protein